jgi:peptidoglycan/LPS O-acetylase OafA/YrhL
VTEQATSRIPSLDGLRAISIGLVVFSHLLWTQDFRQAWESGVDWFAPLGELGVRVFFVISGFLITNLLLRELATKNHIHLGRFYFRRTLRIFPPYYFFLLIVLVLHAGGWIQLASHDVLHSLTYTVNYYPERSWYVGHGWSLSVEEQFYLLWPVVLLSLGKRRGLWVAFAVIILCPLMRLSFWYLWPSLVDEEITYRFETVADAIAVGCLLAGTHEQLRLQPLYHRLLGSRLFILVPLFVLYAGALPRNSRLSLLCGITILNIAIAACIAWSLTNSGGRIGKLLNSKPLVFLGVMSYSIYLWQQPFLNPHSSSMLVSFHLNLFLVGAASLASYYLIERPALGIRHWLEARTRVNLAPAEPSVGLEG